MSQNEFVIGDIVTAFNKTGKYIGEITADRGQAYLVKVLAVLKHPKQGDLHNPNQVDVDFFHERKALAFREQTNVPKNMVRPYNDDIPPYQDSLQLAVNAIKQELESKDTPFSKKSLEAIQELEKEYFK
ncbi:kinase-associated lipoprotein B [Bacillus massiliigorillae]|uniref:kinase-associated lipoprotein B n=1 Tax=Bacillus massiliigorillae TaxID=1243664 RepID=UPI00039AE534|nr:kinase-associated lipoprotein B [Bacillus massiliigorillae]